MAELLAGLSESITSTASVVHLRPPSPWILIPAFGERPAPAHELVLLHNPGAGGDGDEEEDKQEVSVSQRKPKHYRSIAEKNVVDRYSSSSLPGTGTTVPKCKMRGTDRACVCRWASAPRRAIYSNILKLSLLAWLRRPSCIAFSTRFQKSFPRGSRAKQARLCCLAPDECNRQIFF
jgi:hypothetical protein